MEAWNGCVGSAVFMLIWLQPHCSHAASLSVSLSRGAVLVLIFDIYICDLCPHPSDERARDGADELIPLCLSLGEFVVRSPQAHVIVKFQISAIAHPRTRTRT